MPPVIQLDGLAKRYGSVAALRGVSLEVQPGEIFGFLGLNGAGKTTTIRILLDLVRPTSGSAFVFGLSCQHDGLRVRERVAYLPGELGFYQDMTGQRTLDLLVRLSAHPAGGAERRALLDRFELSASDMKRPIREYSTGMKRKLGLVQAFQSEAPLLILDEPTEGLDPLMREVVYQLLDETRRAGRTIFMSSHVLPEVERVCNRIGLLREGELVLQSPVADLRQLAARDVRVVFRADVTSPREKWPEDCQAIEMTPRVWNLRVHGPLGPLVSRLASLPVEDIDVREPHLEDVLKRYYKEETRP
jgi:beta-exotoxin I transport system ATP-binding protein